MCTPTPSLQPQFLIGARVAGLLTRGPRQSHPTGKPTLLSACLLKVWACGGGAHGVPWGAMGCHGVGSPKEEKEEIQVAQHTLELDSQGPLSDTLLTLDKTLDHWVPGVSSAIQQE